MKKIVSLVFTVVLSLAVLNVMATDKNNKKSKASKKVKTTVVKKAIGIQYATSPDGKVTKHKAITIADLKKIKQKAAQK